MTNKNKDELLISGLKIFKQNQLLSIPNEKEIKYEFSEDFKSKTKNLMNKKAKTYTSLFNTIGKKIAIFVVVLIISFIASLSIKAVREAVFKFFYEIFSDNTSVYYYDSTVTEEMTEYFVLPKVPDDFEISEEFTMINSSIAYIEWHNSSGTKLVFSQSNDSHSASFSSNDGEVIKRNVNGIETLYCNNGRFTFCFWTEHDYSFELIYPSHLTDLYMHEVIGNLKETKPIP